MLQHQRRSPRLASLHGRTQLPDVTWGVTEVLQGCYRGVTRALQGCCKIVTRVLQVCYRGLYALTEFLQHRIAPTEVVEIKRLGWG
jgi:hypothetical protein